MTLLADAPASLTGGGASPAQRCAIGLAFSHSSKLATVEKSKSASPNSSNTSMGNASTCLIK